ncbi:MAG: Prevent-host-death protein [Candidatus Gottesmanbacteria bacterium GW2011_GWA2_44_17]|uniref:Antitoxin n=2 Tax=Candidatus Gottesmaniibacteriota TaxID=1752720 RepID=A0A0G1JR33_9BACT|nr:MAG: PhdYeFM [Microgenomates group bacterium GW2011_GWC1_43_11]KKT37322.1 MAG: Prevent-host-death protein [Candidatus Gottesmanbacteria bacterium GW2011_GWB1_44_11c]KKT46372.1 MAG: Prevent-host-death protein [Candidatus Gottesmanbacteria bacterium GW2011_GWA2_44_17]HCM82849.1 antitoxin [Patescibacteria group bacterium]
MTTISISQLKMNPSPIIALASDYPIAVENRNKVKAYIVGKQLFEKIISLLEDSLDTKEVKKADFAKGKNFETVARDLGI